MASSVEYRQYMDEPLVARNQARRDQGLDGSHLLGLLLASGNDGGVIEIAS
jgi:hypothetical protein